MDQIYYKDTLLAIHIQNLAEGSNPVTLPDHHLQMVTVKHPKGTTLKAHTHRPQKRVTSQLQECLVVCKGKIKVDLYSPEKTLFKKIIVNQGEAFITISGGHGIHILEDAEIFELKNGPFIDDKELIA